MKRCGAQVGNTNNLKHGMIGTPTYKTWDAMKCRCGSKNHAAYHNYGGRGITVCDEWLKSFTSFFSDMGVRPSGCSIDRIDNNKGYYKENCRWATYKEQASNRRKRNPSRSVSRTTSGIAGVNVKDGGWQVRINKKYLGFSTDFFKACCLRKSAEIKENK